MAGHVFVHALRLEPAPAEDVDVALECHGFREPEGRKQIRLAGKAAAAMPDRHVAAREVGIGKRAPGSRVIRTHLLVWNRHAPSFLDEQS